MSLIEANNISFSYEESLRPALKDISFRVECGEFIAVLGHNGCGKSTLAKHLNALLIPKSGELIINGMDVSDRGNLWPIRKTCGMVFQNPDNQFVSSIVEEDLAFGPENYDFPEDSIPDIIKESLEIVGMSGYEKKSPHMLSGGQKQRIAIAGVLATDPDVMIMDEATSMLDPEGRKDVLELIKKLNLKHGKTIIMITHYIEEACIADRIMLMKNGQIVRDDTSRSILTDKDLLSQCCITPPLPVKIWHELKNKGVNLARCPLTGKELAEELCR